MADIIELFNKPIEDDLGDVLRQIALSQQPSSRPEIWYHLCPKQQMDNVPMIRGFVCRFCGKRAPDHDAGPYDK